MTYWPVFAFIVIGAIYGFGLALRAFPKETFTIFGGSVFGVGLYSSNIDTAFLGGIPLGFLVLIVFAGYKTCDL